MNGTELHDALRGLRRHPSGRGSPREHVRPVPAGGTGHHPPRLRQESTLTPDLDGGAFHPEPLGDLNPTYGFHV